MSTSNIGGKFGWIAYHKQLFGNERLTSSLLPSLCSSTKHIAVLSSDCELKVENNIQFIELKEQKYKRWIFPFTYKYCDEFDNELIDTIKISEKDVYFMDAASIIIAYLLNINKDSTILDTCSAPGGKALIISKRMLEIVKMTGLKQLRCEIVCNEYNRNRFERLNKVLLNHIGKDNMNLINLETNLGDASNYLSMISLKNKKFTQVLVDAPCSSDRHLISCNSLLEWSMRLVKENYKRQLNILKTSFSFLRNNGVILYCTCSLNNIENDAVVERICMEKNLNSKKCIHSLIKNIEEFNNTQLRARIDVVPLAEEYRRQEFDELKIKTNSFKQSDESDKTCEITLEYSRLGAYILPDRNNGIGPLYVAFIEN